MEITPGLTGTTQITYGNVCSWHQTETRLSILIINVHSLRNKLQALESEIQLHGSPSLVVVSETWLTEGLKQFFCIAGYTAYHTVRSDGYGGLSVYVLENLEHTATTDLSTLHEVHLTKIHFHSINTKVLCAYRAPRHSNVQAFLSMIDPLLERGSNVIMCGDLNFDLLSNNDDVLDFVNVTESNSFAILNSLDESAFTYPRSNSILDIFLTDMIDEQYHVKISPSISDHHACLLLMRGTHALTSRIPIPFRHNLRIISALKSYLGRLSNETLTEIHLEMREIVSRYTFDVLSSKRAKLPWIDNEVISEMEKRNELYRDSRDPLLSANDRERKRQLFKEQKNRVTSLLRRKKNQFIENHVEQSMNDPKKMWQAMKMVLHKHPSNQNNGIPNAIEKTDGSTTTDPKEVLDCMNTHFCTVGQRINEESRQANNNRPRNSPTAEQSADEITLHDTNHRELFNIIISLKNDAAAGLDGISVKNLKAIAHVLSRKLVNPMNVSMRNGSFPQSFKEVRIRALYKGKGSKKNCNNYRPISVLSNVSKIYEKLLYLRFYCFLTETDFVAKTQFGFLPNSSTTSATLHAITKIRESLDAGKCTAAVFIDVAKAFDSINHCLLLEKLDFAGIRGKANMIIQDYLFDRRQRIVCGDTISDELSTRFGIPQGSNLSSLLFLVYVNQCLSLPLMGYLQMYADDSIIIYSCDSLEQLHLHIQEDLTKINGWMYDNFLSFNPDKTNYMLFRGNSQSTSHTLSPIFVNQTPILQTNSARYLGLVIDSQLKWDLHVEEIRRKLLPYLFILRNTKYILSRTVKLSLYYAYIHSHLSYLISIWGYTGATRLRQLQVIQNKAIRLLFWQEYVTGNISTAALLLKYRVPNIEQLMRIDSMTIIFKIKNGLIRNNLRLTTFADVHGYDTRNRNNFLIPRTRSNMLYNSIFARGLSLFNELPGRIKVIDTVGQFRCALKEGIFLHSHN